MNASLFHLRRLFARLLALTGLCASLSVFAQTNVSPAENLTAAVTQSVVSNESSNAVFAQTNGVAEIASAPTAAGSNTNQTSKLQFNDPLPSPLASLGRVMLMLAVVLAIFIGGVWLFRNWQRFTTHRGQAPKLNVLETRSLGGRHAIYVIGYENERLLISSSPGGINLLTHLQPSDEPVTNQNPGTPAPTFAATLAQMLKGKQS